MEAVGLAAGIVSLGLDLGTRLHTYVEGVKGAGDLLSALASDVSATASIVRQLADLLAAADGLRLFTAEGVADIEAVLRRCRRAYGVIVDVLLGVASGAASRTHAVLTAAGIGELTAARLARLSSRARWPWLEPRVRSCRAELREVKMDLLLSLHVAGLLRHRLGSTGDSDMTGTEEGGGAADQGEQGNDEEGEALLAVATNLMQRRRSGGDEAAFSSSWESDESSDDSDDSSNASRALSRASLKPLEGKELSARHVPHMTTSAEAQTAPPAELQGEAPDTPPEQHQQPPNGFADLAEGLSIGSLVDAGTDMEAWLIGHEAPGHLFTMPVRGPSMRAILAAHEARSRTEGEAPSTLEQLVSLEPPLRTAVWEVMDRVQQRDARVRTLVGLLTPKTVKGLPEACELLALVSAGDEEEVVHLEDSEGRTWRVPFYALKSSLARADGKAGVERTLLRHCDGGPSSLGVGAVGPGFHLRALSGDSVVGELVSLCGLHDHLRPGLRIRMHENDSNHWWRRQGAGNVVAQIPGPLPGALARDGGSVDSSHDLGWMQKRKRRRLSGDSESLSSEDDLEFQELFGDEAEAGTTAMDGIESVEGLLARWALKREEVAS